jgi:hypothetical protein
VYIFNGKGEVASSLTAGFEKLKEVSTILERTATLDKGTAERVFPCDSPPSQLEQVLRT